jgi:tetratricopeptide (TPR) repeat protein
MAESSDVAEAKSPDIRKTIARGLLVSVGVSFLVILIYALRFLGGKDVYQQAISVFANAALLAGASLGIGTLLGFLFGIPRTVEEHRPTPNPAPGAAASDPSKPPDQEYRQQVNTNLEQISDWLTKILVGVGLTQLSSLPEQMRRLGTSFGPELGNNSTVAIVIVLNFMVVGFFVGYLITRLVLAPAFKDADTKQPGEQFRLASSLESVGGHVQAAVAFEKALESISPETPKDTKRKTYEGVVYNSLYDPPPEGFRRSIRYGLQFVAQEPDASSRVWFSLAAAYGQQYRYGSEHGAPKDEQDAARAGALKAITACIRLEPKMKASLRTLWDPNDPNKLDKSENDLEVFHEDSDFKKLLD